MVNEPSVFEPLKFYCFKFNMYATLSCLFFTKGDNSWYFLSISLYEDALLKRDILFCKKGFPSGRAIFFHLTHLCQTDCSISIYCISSFIFKGCLVDGGIIVITCPSVCPSVIIPCPLNNSETLRDIFMKLGIYIKHC